MSDTDTTSPEEEHWGLLTAFHSESLSTFTAICGSTFILILLFFSSCEEANERPYSFFVAGHTYGAPGVDNFGLHPPFKHKFDYIKGRKEIAFGVLTGDIVAPFPTVEDWEEVDADIDTLGLPIHMAVGNHDMENRALYESRYGRTYYSFVTHNDLFIVLDPNIDGWNISGEQLDFLRTELNEKASESGLVFVFFHQVIWWDNESEFSYLKLNSFAGRGDSTNFWTEVAPLFRDLSQEVVMFAGDLGASWTTDVSYDRIDNLTLIASGMGDADGENFVVVNVGEDKSVSYDLICLSDIVQDCLGNLEDHWKVKEEGD